MYLLFDIGGTKTRVTVWTPQKEKFVEPIVFETPQDFDKGVAVISKAAEKLTAGKTLQGACGGIRGPLDQGKASLVSDDVLVGWVGKPLAEKLQLALKTSVHLENDAALAALGEAMHGAGRGHEIVAYFTVSTGVGGARVVRGAIDEASTGFEPGKQVVDIDHTLLPSGKSSTLEDVVSGSSLERRFNKKAYEIPQVDPVWKELAMWLSYGLKNAVLLWSPNVIVFGGSMMLGDPRISLEEVRTALQELLKDMPAMPELKLAELGDFSGLYGAMALTKREEQ